MYDLTNEYLIKLLGVMCDISDTLKSINEKLSSKEEPVQKEECIPQKTSSTPQHYDEWSGFIRLLSELAKKYESELNFNDMPLPRKEPD